MERNREKICETLCGKKGCTNNIHDCDGKLSQRCRDLQKSFIKNLNDNQVMYILSSIDEDIFLNACPGSGKTEVLAIKSSYEVQRWRNKYKGIAILTFTNSAEDEIRNRIEIYLNETLKYPHYIGTFTSWIHGYIANPFLSKITNYKGNENHDKSIRIIENSSDSNFLNAFSSKYNYKELGKLKPQEYYLEFRTNEYIYCGNRSRNGQEILQELLSEDKWRFSDLDRIKKRFWEKGFCLYEDVEYLVYLLLKEDKEILKLIANKFKVILIDECQDLSYIQLEIIKLLHKQGCIIHLIGDLNQAIYKFRNIEPNDTLEFINELKFKEMQLNQNYRSCQKIVDMSECIINRNSNIIGCNIQMVSEPLVAILYKKDKEREALKIFDNLVKENHLISENSRVIVRNNNLKNKLLGLKTQVKSSNILEDLARAIYLSINGKDISEFRTAFLLFAKAIQKIYFKDSEHLNGTYFYKPSIIDMSEWKEIVSRIKNILISQNVLLDFSKCWNEWKSSLEEVVIKLVMTLPDLTDKEYDLGRIRNGNAKKTVQEILFRNNSTMEYKIETIHSCKGMSLDAVLFMSSYQTSGDKESGAYWKQWFDREIINENNRLAYVSFSRAKQLLALGIPNSSTFTDEDKVILESCGFRVIET
ncbi:MAG: ATP-dependent helicase [Clostridium beijerinckii]|jgi:DNA helicase-2/ATP-dependent DNA helicase PcrA|nr:ATP-dependent helicase [Clostridium beijerinckii]MCI1583790.1 ATP-dependent helicase [Clostridium beijerinckii]MCI1623854.1 ATP-dependent helicase [Clostridium beijerinckii]